MRGHEGRKFTQRLQSRDEPRSEAVIQSESVVVTFASSECKTPTEKMIRTEIAKQRTGPTDRRGHPIRIGLCDLCDLCV